MISIYLYFFFSIATFAVFFFLPLIILKPWKRRDLLSTSISESELKQLFSSRATHDKHFLNIKRLSGATKVEIFTLRNQSFIELQFQSLRDSLNFKQSVLQAGLCLEPHITIIREKHYFMVIFFAPQPSVRL